MPAGTSGPAGGGARVSPAPWGGPQKHVPVACCARPAALQSQRGAGGGKARAGGQQKLQPGTPGQAGWAGGAGGEGPGAPGEHCLWGGNPSDPSLPRFVLAGVFYQGKAML